jgi:NTE family protein
VRANTRKNEADIAITTPGREYWGLQKKLEINLALQGGGAHGAFTWGVIDRLLEDDRLKFGWISATSAGAVNAVALAAGLAEGTREKARAKMFAVWQAVHKAGVPDLTRLYPFLNGLSRQPALAHMATMWSPYDFNPLGFDPLRRLLSEQIDFELIREKSPVELLIAATHVSSGRVRFFRRQDLSVDAVLASACLPTMHHAVKIDGEAYWDGGYSANPDLVTLGVESPVQDTLIVLLAPRELNELPTSVQDIANHVNRLTFNAPLLRDVEVITAVRESSGSILSKGRLSRLAKHRYHIIDAAEFTGSMHPETSIKPDWGVITYLHGAGRAMAEKWLGTSRASIGKAETADLKSHFFPDVAGTAPRDGGATVKTGRSKGAALAVSPKTKAAE